MNMHKQVQVAADWLNSGDRWRVEYVCNKMHPFGHWECKPLPSTPAWFANLNWPVSLSPQILLGLAQSEGWRASLCPTCGQDKEDGPYCSDGFHVDADMDTCTDSDYGTARAQAAADWLNSGNRWRVVGYTNGDGSWQVTPVRGSAAQIVSTLWPKHIVNEGLIRMAIADGWNDANSSDASEVARLRGLIARLAPEYPINQDEMGGCVWCCGHPEGEPYGYASEDPKDHEDGCPWVEARALLTEANAVSIASDSEERGEQG